MYRSVVNFQTLKLTDSTIEALTTPPSTVLRLSEVGGTNRTDNTYRANVGCPRVGFRSTEVTSFTRRGPQLE